jgi:hypothetical protein
MQGLEVITGRPNNTRGGDWRGAAHNKGLWSNQQGLKTGHQTKEGQQASAYASFIRAQRRAGEMGRRRGARAPVPHVGTIEHHCRAANTGQNEDLSG